MKIAITTALIAFSSIAISEERVLEIQQQFLSDRTELGAWEIENHAANLNKSLSADLMKNVTQHTQPFYVSNIKALQSAINTEKTAKNPQLRLSVDTFEGQAPLTLMIDQISTRHTRDILRGKVEGHDDSRVKLVVHNRKMSGQIAFASTEKVLVIRSMEGGATATYEVDVSDITYD
ncbi:hypothetical protein [Marinibactrum halimedae]|uniref:Uncharacterized protein n=1 Tax=Marinibactrum halimedae TaxID=1444977 RepID=A0AA37TAF3_9GAMM|nr:hypothetical protein [Marinibactrum halimedae]MCD9459039.1 hypothetical protein [Marinibactrum halimedae]GLS26831.1 hypothetical protein GCM10007877_25500 [Marinibactrum halimedae]